MRFADLAGRQHGVVARRQLVAIGVSGDRIAGRVGRRQLHPIHRGVYAVGHRALRIEGRWMAAVLAGGPGARLSHRSAAQAWQLLRPAGGPVEITRASGWRAPAGIVAHRSLLPPDEVATIDGIPVTSFPRTILDLAAVAPRRWVERAMNEAEVRGLTDPLSIPDLLARYPGRRGTAVLGALLEDDDAARGVTVNDFEGAFAALLDAHRIPRPRFNPDLFVRGRFIRPDALWGEQMVIVELDGRASHGTARAFERDRERDRLLLADGWQVMRVTWRQFRHEPSEVIADLRRVLGPGATRASPPATSVASLG